MKIIKILNNKINEMFEEIAKANNLKSGDFAPEQEFELNKIRNRFSHLLSQYVKQNTY